MRSSFQGRVCWVELAGVAHSDDVGSTLARAVEVTPEAGESVLAALCRRLARDRVLLLLDNFEHLLDAAGPLGQLVARSPAVSVVVTSREPLNLAGEQVVRVAPLALSAVPDRAIVSEVRSTAASALFVAAVRRRDSGFAITPATAPVIARLCARLDGLPLALELAAARTVLTGVEELAANLDIGRDGLGFGPRDAPSRHRTLDATIDWSHRLLDDG